MSVTDTARGLGVARHTLSRVVDGHAGISPETAIRLEQAGWSNAEFRPRRQMTFDLVQTRRQKRPTRHPQADRSSWRAPRSLAPWGGEQSPGMNVFDACVAVAFTVLADARHAAVLERSRVACMRASHLDPAPSSNLVDGSRAALQIGGRTFTSESAAIMTGMHGMTVSEPEVGSGAWDPLAWQHAPVIRCDDREPFLPRAVGYAIHESDGTSLLARHPVTLKGAGRAVEYLVWWDWGLRHPGTVEFVRVHLDRTGHPVRVETFSGSGSGSVREYCRQDLPLDSGRIVFLAEPGSHRLATGPGQFDRDPAAAPKHRGGGSTGAAGSALDLPGVTIGDMTAHERHLAGKFLRGRAFNPAFDFGQVVDLRTLPAMKLDRFGATIPGRIDAQLARLKAEARGVKAVLLDSGDTLIDENSQIFAEGELVIRADPVPGGDSLVAELKKRGYLVALVADGLAESFRNVHGQLGFWDLFDARAISEAVGVTKPDRRMFDLATRNLGLTEDDYPGCVMVGNNLERDIAGANRLGMWSVWISWTNNYPTRPANEDERPDFEIGLPHDLIGVLEEIDAME